MIMELCNCKHIAHPSQEAPAYSGVLELACRVSHVNMKFVRGLILRVVVTRSDASSRTYSLCTALAEHSGARLAPTFLLCTERKRCLILFKIKSFFDKAEKLYNPIEFTPTPWLTLLLVLE